MQLAVSAIIAGKAYDIYTGLAHDAPSLQHLRIILSSDLLAIWDNNQKVWQKSFQQLGVDPLHWSTLYLHLLQSSSAGKPDRAIFFIACWCNNCRHRGRNSGSNVQGVRDIESSGDVP